MAEPTTHIPWHKISAAATGVLMAGVLQAQSVEAMKDKDPAFVYAASIERTPGKFLKHAEATNAILRNSATSLPESKVQVDFVDFLDMIREKKDKPGHLTHHPERSPILHSILQHYDVLSFSMSAGAMGKSILAKNEIVFNFSNDDAFWDQQKTIVVQGAGNDGQMPDEDRQKEPTSLSRYAKWLQVGAATIVHDPDSADHIQSASYSSASDPSFITLNPFEQGFKTSLFRPVGDLWQNHASLKMSSFPPAFEDCAKPPKFSKLTISNPDWFRQEAGERLVVDCLEKRYATFADENGVPYQAPEGTSFTTPNAAGMIASVMDRERGLMPEDYVAAALLAAKPLTEDLNIFYQPNGSGVVAYDITGKTGLGLLDQAGLDETVRTLIDIKSGEDVPDTIPNRVGSGLLPFDQPDFVNTLNDEASVADKFNPARSKNKWNAYDLPIGEDSVNIRTMAEIRLKGNYDPAIPPAIGLTSPDGVYMPLVLTVAAGKDPTIYASTNAFFGTRAAGTWRLEILNAEIAAASITVGGVKPGGVLDRSIQQRREGAAPAPAMDPIVEYDALMKRLKEPLSAPVSPRVLAPHP